MTDHPVNARSLVLPPPAMPRFDPARSWRDLRTDYAAHPAYRSLLAFRPGTLLRFSAGAAKLFVKRLINYEAIPADIRNGNPGSFALAALGNFVRGGAFGAMMGRAGAGPLAETGVAVFPLPERALASLQAAAAPCFSALEARRARTVAGSRDFEDSRGSARRAEAATLFELIEQQFEACGLFEAASAYLGRQVKLVDVNPQINDRSDSFWRDIFPDLSLPSLPKTAYCHRDASGGDLKAIIYMTDVGPNNGPFSYAVGSNRCHISRIDDFICEANDMNGFSATTPGARKAFAGLPAKLRQKGSFGNDLIDDSPASAAIAEHFGRSRVRPVQSCCLIPKAFIAAAWWKKVNAGSLPA